MKTVQKLNYLEELIDEEYLDEKDESSLREGLYAGLLAGLKDPYSTYYTAEQYKELNTSNEGSYVGIGAVLQKDDTGGAKIIQLYEGGPGEQAGLKKGDVIKAVDGADVTDKETSDIASMVRDSEKDSVMLTIQRENEEKPGMSKWRSGMWRFRPFPMRCFPKTPAISGSPNFLR